MRDSLAAVLVAMLPERSERSLLLAEKIFEFLVETKKFIVVMALQRC